MKYKINKSLYVIIEEYFHDLKVVRDFLNRTQKVPTTKENINTLENVKIKTFLHHKILRQANSGRRYLKYMCSAKKVI